jgi:hypothetical protein
MRQKEYDQATPGHQSTMSRRPVRPVSQSRLTSSLSAIQRKPVDVEFAQAEGPIEVAFAKLKTLLPKTTPMGGLG